MKKHLLVLSILAIGILAGCKKTTEDVVKNDDLSLIPEAAFVGINGEVVPNELIVKFKSGTNEKSRTQTLSFINGNVAEHIVTKTMERFGDKEGVYLVNTDVECF